MPIPRRLQTLDWHVSRLRSKQYYSFVRWGDAEMKALFFEQGNTGGHGRYKLTPETRKAMNQALLKYYEEKDLVFGCAYRVLKWMNERSDFWLKKHRLSDIYWVDCTIFKGSSKYGKLFPLIKELRRQKVIVIGPWFLTRLPQRTFKYLDFIQIDPKKGYWDQTVIPRVLKCREKHGNGIVYSFSAGIGSNIFIPNLHRRMAGNFLIDFGSVWDVFCGAPSRHYMTPALYTEKTLKLNLGIKEG